MTTKKPAMTVTGMVVTGMAIVLAIYDAIVINQYGIEASVSRFLQETSLASPMFSVAVGVLIGHLFCYMSPRVPPAILLMMLCGCSSQVSIDIQRKSWEPPPIAQPEVEKQEPTQVHELPEEWTQEIEADDTPIVSEVSEEPEEPMQVVQPRSNKLEFALESPVEPVEELSSDQFAEPRKLIVWKPNFPCSWCEKLADELRSTGFECEHRDGSPEWLAVVLKQDPKVGFPLYEWTDSNGKWRYAYGYKKTAEIERITGLKRGNPLAFTARSIRRGPIRGRAIIVSAVDLLEKEIGETPLVIEWERSGKRELRVGQNWTSQDLVGDSGRVTITGHMRSTGISRLKFDYAMKNGILEVTAMEFAVPFSPQLVATGEQPVGSILIISTIASLAFHLHALLHPAIDVILEPKSTYSISTRDRVLSVEMQNSPSVRMKWYEWLGRFAPRIDLKTTGCSVDMTANTWRLGLKSSWVSDVTGEIVE